MENHIRKITTKNTVPKWKNNNSKYSNIVKDNFSKQRLSLPEQTVSKIHTILFNYLWQNKKPEPIA